MQDKIEKLLYQLKTVVGVDDYQQLQKPFLIAEEAHKKQRRYNGDPYIIHPLRVSLILAEELKIGDLDILTVALLHDVVEDSYYSLDDIAKLFNQNIVDGVKVLTKVPNFKDDVPLQKKYFWHLKRSPKNVQITKLSDRLDNMRDLYACDNELKLRKYLYDTEYNYLTWAKKICPYIGGELEDLLFQYHQDLGDMGSN